MRHHISLTLNILVYKGVLITVVQYLCIFESRDVGYIRTCKSEHLVIAYKSCQCYHTTGSMDEIVHSRDAVKSWLCHWLATLVSLRQDNRSGHNTTERLKHFLIANGVTEAEKKHIILLCIIGPTCTCTCINY